MISAANKIPQMLTPNVIKGDVQHDEDDEKVQIKSAQDDLSECKPKQNEVGLEEILQKVNLSGTTDWDPAEQWDAHNLTHRHACIFS